MGKLISGMTIINDEVVCHWLNTDHCDKNKMIVLDIHIMNGQIFGNFIILKLLT